MLPPPYKGLLARRSAEYARHGAPFALFIVLSHAGEGGTKLIIIRPTGSSRYGNAPRPASPCPGPSRHLRSVPHALTSSRSPWGRPAGREGRCPGAPGGKQKLQAGAKGRVRCPAGPNVAPQSHGASHRREEDSAGIFNHARIFLLLFVAEKATQRRGRGSRQFSCGEAAAPPEAGRPPSPSRPIAGTNAGALREKREARSGHIYDFPIGIINRAIDFLSPIDRSIDRSYLFLSVGSSIRQCVTVTAQCQWFDCTVDFRRCKVFTIIRPKVASKPSLAVKGHPDGHPISHAYARAHACVRVCSSSS